MESPNVMIHVRFAPNGTVVEISERPAGRNPQEWFEYLTDKVGGDTYQPLSGGRGVFRLMREKVDALKAETVLSAA
jgi:hypothetical protein